MTDTIDRAKLMQDLLVQTTIKCPKCDNMITGIPSIEAHIVDGVLVVNGGLWCPTCNRYRNFNIDYVQKKAKRIGVI